MSSLTEFLVTLFLGPFGVHRFICGEIGMGVLYLFTCGGCVVGWIIDTVRAGVALYRSILLRTAEPPAKLPVADGSGLVLQEGEFCCLRQAAENLQVKNVVVGRKSNTGGMSVRVMKGVRLRSGNSTSAVIRGNVAQRTRGMFYITNKRVVMVCPKGAFDKPLSAVSSAVRQRNGLLLQFGSDNHALVIKNAAYVQQVLDVAIHQSSLPAMPEKSGG